MTISSPRLNEDQTISVRATQEEWEAVFTLCAEGGQSLSHRRIDAVRVVRLALRVIARAQRGEAAEIRKTKEAEHVAGVSYN